MIFGIKLQAKPTPLQAKILSSWMGAAKTVWNAKCEEDKYLRTFARKYLSLGTFPRPDQKYSQYKDDVLTPWLKECPSQILRNSASNWYASYQKFFKQKERGRPKRKKSGEGLSIHLTQEVFSFDKTSHGLKLFIGTEKNNIGYLEVNWHDKKWRQYGNPKSIRIKKLPSGKFTVSFCYGKERKKYNEKKERKDWLKYLNEHKEENSLKEIVLGIDRGVNVAVVTDKEHIPFKEKAKKGFLKYKKKLKRQQIKFSKQKNKSSNRRYRRKLKVAKIYNKITNIRENECHHITKSLVTSNAKVFILEDLPIKNQTKRAQGTQEKPGKNVKQKSGLNREILNISWGRIETQLKYKARKYSKIVFKINPAYTSQECANCGHTHHSNRNGTTFNCVECGHKDHADTNAAKIIKKRAVKLILNSGTELSDKGVLLCPKDKGRGAKVRPNKSGILIGRSEKDRNIKETSKKIRSICPAFAS